MEKEIITKEVKSILKRLAPEVESQSVDTLRPFRDEYQLDSMDFNNFIIGINEKFGIEVPEKDYTKLSSIDEIANYIKNALNQVEHK